MKMRRLCAIAGVAAASGAVLFTESLSTTNDEQAPAAARRMLCAMPVEEGALFAAMPIDYRPGGRVMQGPPLTASIATRRGTDGIAVSKAVFARRRLAPPAVGDDLRLVGRNGAYTLKVSEILDWDKPAGRQTRYPDSFVSPETAAAIGEDWEEFSTPPLSALAEGFKSDESRNIDKSRLLLLWAAALTSVAMLANSILLAIEARRREIALLRMLGATRLRLSANLFAGAFALCAAGVALGAAGSRVALGMFVSSMPETFPEGAFFSWRALAAVAAAAPLVALAAGAAALKSAFSVRPLELASLEPQKSVHAGMAVAFALGFGSFVAVETWGTSLMGAFVPSPEWPDAIVSILPRGVPPSACDALQSLEGVEWIAPLRRLQLDILPLEEIPSPRGAPQSGKGRPGGARRGARPGGAPPSAAVRGVRPEGARPQFRNALLLASPHLPGFKFSSGDRVAALAALESGEGCLVTEMMARARKLAPGDTLELDRRGLPPLRLKVAGVVDLNWHMVTSRGLLRGLDGMPVHTDGPVFVSPRCIAAASGDAASAADTPLTHLWLSFEKDFLARHGAFEAGCIAEREIASALGGAADASAVRLHSRDEIADGTFAHGNDIIGAMAKVPFIFIAVLSLGFVAMLVAEADARKREFAVYRAAGASRRRVAGMLAASAARTAARGVAGGIVLGAPAGWLFTFATRSAMSAWGLPPAFSVPWATVALGALAAVAVALAVAVPASAAVVRRGERF